VGGELPPGAPAPDGRRGVRLGGAPPAGPSPRLAKVPQVQDDRKDSIRDGELSAVVAPLAEAAVEAVLVAALEALAEVVVVIALVHVHSGVAVVRVLVGVRALVPAPVAVLTVGLARGHALLVAAVHRLAQEVGAVAVRLVRAPAPRVAVGGSGREGGIARVVVRPPAGDTALLVAQPG